MAFKNSTTLADLTDKKELIPIFKAFFKELSKTIIRENYWWKVPFKNGIIRIRKKDGKTSLRKALNHVKTKELGFPVFYKNLHTNGYYFEWYWDKQYKRTLSKSIKLRKFKPIRVFKERIEPTYGKEGLHKWIMECYNNPKLKEYDAEL